MSDVATAATKQSLLTPHSRWTALLWFMVLAALVVGLITAIHRGLHVQPDWGDLDFESRYVWQHGATRPGTAMFGYLPAATFFLWPFTVALPAPTGVIAWGLFNVALAVTSIGVVTRHWLNARWTYAPAALAAALVAGNVAHALGANQLTLVTLFLCAAGLAGIHRQRPWLGGGALGAAAALKTLPFLFAIYLVLTRRWRALLGFAAAVLIVDALPSLVFFGPARAIEEHRLWLERASWHSNRRLVEEPFLRVHRHGSNASLSAVLTRWLRQPPAATRQTILYGNPPPEIVAQFRAALAPDELLTIDPMPPDEGRWSVKRIADLSWIPRFHLCAWSAETVWSLWAGLLALAGTGLLWLTWRSSQSAHAPWQPLAAVWMLAMFYPSPMLRHYYLAWALPAIAIVCQQLFVTRGDPAARRRNNCVFGVAALAAWLVGIFSLGWPLVRWYGLHLAVLILLTTAVVVICRSVNARPHSQRS